MCLILPPSSLNQTNLSHYTVHSGDKPVIYMWSHFSYSPTADYYHFNVTITNILSGFNSLLYPSYTRQCYMRLYVPVCSQLPRDCAKHRMGGHLYFDIFLYEWVYESHSYSHILVIVTTGLCSTEQCRLTHVLILFCDSILNPTTMKFVFHINSSCLQWFNVDLLSGIV